MWKPVAWSHQSCDQPLQTSREALTHLLSVQLWWGNYGGPAMVKLEFCNLSHGLASGETKPRSMLRDIEDEVEDVMEEFLETATDDELAAHGCIFSTDLSKIFAKPSATTPLPALQF